MRLRERCLRAQFLGGDLEPLVRRADGHEVAGARNGVPRCAGHSIGHGLVDEGGYLPGDRLVLAIGGRAVGWRLRRRPNVGIGVRRLEPSRRCLERSTRRNFRRRRLQSRARARCVGRNR